jgi:hypothetical protein
MPFHKQSYKTGNLFIVFKVTFPTQVGVKEVALISSAL